MSTTTAPVDTAVVERPGLTPVLAATNRHGYRRRRRQQIRAWLRGLVAMRLPAFGDMQ